MSRIVLMAETGADIPPELANRYGIHIVPMHVSFGGVSRDDGTFPSEEICGYFDRTGELPKTSGSKGRCHKKTWKNPVKSMFLRAAENGAAQTSEQLHRKRAMSVRHRPFLRPGERRKF